MPSPVISPNTYAGRLLQPYAARIILGTRTFTNNPKLARVLPGINGIAKIRKVDQTVNFQDNTVDFNPDGETQLGEKAIIPVRMSVQSSFDRDKLYTSWEADLIAAGINKVNMPTELETAVVSLTANRIAAGVENLAWNGKSSRTSVATYGFTEAFPGWLAQAAANAPAAQRSAVGATGRLAFTGINSSGAVVTVASTANLRTGDTVTVNSANGNQVYLGNSIVGQSFKVRIINATTFALQDPVTNAAINFTGTTAATSGFVNFINVVSVQEALAIAWANTPNNIRLNETEDPIIYVSNDVMIAYKNSISIAASLQSGYTNTRTEIWANKLTDTYNGVRMEVIPGQAAGSILVSQPSNLLFGLSVFSDMDTVLVVDRRGAELRNDIGMRVDFSGIAELLWPEDVSIVSTVIVP